LFAGAAIPAHKQFPRNFRGNDSSAWPGQSQVNDTKIAAPCGSNRPAATASLKSDANKLSNSISGHRLAEERGVLPESHPGREGRSSAAGNAPGLRLLVDELLLVATTGRTDVRQRVLAIQVSLLGYDG
jgi:hypothetical protein